MSLKCKGGGEGRPVDRLDVRTRTRYRGRRRQGQLMKQNLLKRAGKGLEHAKGGREREG